LLPAKPPAFHLWLKLDAPRPITPKFGVGSSFHPGSEPSQGATQNVGPWPCPQPHPLCSLVP